MKSPLSPVKRAFRYSLRLVLLAMTMCCVFLGIEANRIAKQRRAVAAILAAGGRVVYEHKTRISGRTYSRCPSLKSVQLDCDNDGGVPRAAYISLLQELGVSYQP